MEVREYNTTSLSDWDVFINDHSFNGTIFHTQKFLSYHEEGKFKDRSVLIYDNNEIQCVFPCCYIEARGYVSHGGSSHGGPVLRKGLKASYVKEVISCLSDHYKDHPLFMRIPEQVFADSSIDSILYSFMSKGFSLRSELSVSSSLNHFNERIANNNRRYIKKYSKPPYELVTTHQDQDYTDFHEVLCGNLTKHQTTPTHSIEELLRLKNIIGENNCFLNLIKQDNKILSGVWNIKCREAWYAFYIVKDYSIKGNNSTPCSLHQAMNISHERGGTDYCFGICTENNGSYLNEGLINFKESLGGVPVLRYILSNI